MSAKIWQDQDKFGYQYWPTDVRTPGAEEAPHPPRGSLFAGLFADPAKVGEVEALCRFQPVPQHAIETAMRQP